MFSVIVAHIHAALLCARLLAVLSITPDPSLCAVVPSYVHPTSWWRLCLVRRKRKKLAEACSSSEWRSGILFGFAMDGRGLWYISACDIICT